LVVDVEVEGVDDFLNGTLKPFGELVVLQEVYLRDLVDLLGV